jgi:hypothetical protein
MLTMRAPVGLLGGFAPDCVIVTGWPATVSVPVRGDVLVFAVRRYRTVPLPDPLAPLAIVIQDPERVAVHEHPLLTVTATLPFPLDDLKSWLVGVTAYAHAPFCVTSKVAFPTVSVAVRAADVVFSATLKFTVPFPDPEPPPVTLSQLAELVADHAQVLPAVTATLPVAAVASTVVVVGESEYVHAPLCRTLRLAVPTVRLAVRDAVEMLAATL